jgi:hypothetical protein
VNRAARLAVACLIALLAGAYVVRLAAAMPHYGTDFDPIRFGARLLVHGENPYTIGPDQPHYWNFPLLYPLPAVLLVVPFVALPVVAARAAFVGLTSGLLAFVATRRSWWPLLVFASASWWSAIGLAQWSPLLLAAWYVPALGFAATAKPNVGAAIVAGARNRRSLFLAAVGAVAVVAVSFVVRPSWLGEWLGAIHAQPHIRPLVSVWLGAPLLLAVLRWRRPEARLLLWLAVVPANPGIYDALLLFAIPATAREALVLATLSWFAEPLRYAVHSANSFEGGAHAWALAMLPLMYLPALAMVLMRPNEGPRADVEHF